MRTEAPLSETSPWKPFIYSQSVRRTDTVTEQDEHSPQQAAIAVPPCSATGQCLSASVGPAHKQPTVNERLLIVLLNNCSAPQWALPTGNCQWETTVGK